MQPMQSPASLIGLNPLDSPSKRKAVIGSVSVSRVSLLHLNDKYDAEDVRSDKVVQRYICLVVHLVRFAMQRAHELIHRLRSILDS